MVRPQFRALKARGYDFDRAVARVAEVMGLATELVTAFGKSPQTVQARALLCFWAHRKLGMSTIEIAKKIQDKPTGGESFIKKG